MEHLVACPLCAGKDIEPYPLTPNDFHTNSGRYFLSECKSCRLVFTNPRPKEEELEKFYYSDSYISHARVGKNLKDRLYFVAQHYMLKKKFQLLQAHQLPITRVLDYGCGAGAFLEYVRKKGMFAVGYEPNANAAILTCNAVVPVYTNLAELDLEQPLPFDAITLWHVLEHSPMLSQTIRYLNNRLKPGGWAIIAVPLIDSYDCSFYQQYWAAYDLPRHLLHFTPQTLIRAFEEFGFHFVRTIGLPLDAYYISLLSESYKGAKPGFLRALLVATISNGFARVGRKSWSSQIFIFEKPN